MTIALSILKFKHSILKIYTFKKALHESIICSNEKINDNVTFITIHKYT